MSEINRESQDSTDPDPFRIKLRQTSHWNFIDLQHRSWIMFVNAEGTGMRCLMDAQVFEHGIQGLENNKLVRLTSAEKIADWRPNPHLLLMQESIDHQSLAPIVIPARLTIECHPLLSHQIQMEKQRQLDAVMRMQEIPDHLDMNALSEQLILPQWKEITDQCPAMKPLADTFQNQSSRSIRFIQEQLHIIQALLYPKFALAESVNALYDGRRKQFHEHLEVKIDNRWERIDVFMDDGASCSVMDLQLVQENHIPFLSTQKHVQTMYGGSDLPMVEVLFRIPEKIAGNIPEAARLLPLTMVVYDLSQTGPRQILVGMDFVEMGKKREIFSFQEPKFLPYQGDSSAISHIQDTN